jgi:hypothetical protein
MRYFISKPNQLKLVFVSIPILLLISNWAKCLCLFSFFRTPLTCPRHALARSCAASCARLRPTTRTSGTPLPWLISPSSRCCSRGERSSAASEEKESSTDRQRHLPNYAISLMISLEMARNGKEGINNLHFCC